MAKYDKMIAENKVKKEKIELHKLLIMKTKSSEMEQMERVSEISKDG